MECARTPDPNPVLEAAYWLGSRAAVAAVVEQPPQAASRWIRRRKLPAKHASKVEEAVKAKGGYVPKEALAPDFPWPETADA
jgi:DNA-binding transcriptional regulator YdaS (Cro superfamily)